MKKINCWHSYYQAICTVFIRFSYHWKQVYKVLHKHVSNCTKTLRWLHHQIKVIFQLHGSIIESLSHMCSITEFKTLHYITLTTLFLREKFIYLEIQKAIQQNLVPLIKIPPKTRTERYTLKILKHIPQS